MGPIHGDSEILVGTAGWNIPPSQKEFFPPEGTHLTRYAQVLNGVEINSAFYREHKPETYMKWAQSTPENFRFSVKLLRYFTQEKRLKETGSRLQEVIEGMMGLQDKFGVLLVQLPPSLDFHAPTVEKFLNDLRKVYTGLLAWEPRHQSWKDEVALRLLADYEVNKVLADPEPVFLTRDQRAPVEKNLVYYRLHGTPDIYKSKYEPARIQSLRNRLQEAKNEGKSVWCIFDNTTFGYATENALDLKGQLRPVGWTQQENRALAPD
jgi:uncharacterized protein YecE (DUF72 family)